jgi:hypothetical protein
VQILKLEEVFQMPRWLKYVLIALALFFLISAPLAMQTGGLFR